MKGVYFIAEASSLFMRVEVWEESGEKWSHVLDAETPAEWLAQRTEEANKADVVLVIPEECLWRRLVALPMASRASRQDEILRSWLMAEFADNVGAFQWYMVAQASGGKAIFSVVGIGERWLQERLAVFGAQAGRVQLISEGNYCMASVDVPENGYVQLGNHVSPTVLSIYHQRIVDGRCTQTDTEQALLARMQQIHTRLGLEELSNCSLSVVYDCDGMRKSLTLEDYLKRPMKAKTAQRRPVLMILVFICVILPLGVLAMSKTQLHQQETILATETESSARGVVRSHYSHLMAIANEAQTERVTIDKLEATQSSLFISGSCPNSLDLADYLKRMDESDDASTALLTELKRISEKEAIHYEFIIQLSEGGSLE